VLSDCRVTKGSDGPPLCWVPSSMRPHSFCWVLIEGRKMGWPNSSRASLGVTSGAASAVQELRRDHWKMHADE
jgi:hypothetical protein